MRTSLWLPVALLVWCAGCASLKPATPIPDFDLLGRVSVGYEGPNFSSNVRWKHADGVDHIWLMTPLGQTLAYIEDGATGASLTAADQQVYRAGSVEGLTSRALGWELPLAELRYWVRGEVVPGAAAEGVQRTSDGTLLELTQSGWRITFTPEATRSDHRPRRLQLVKGAQQIRFIVDEWRVAAAEP